MCIWTTNAFTASAVSSFQGAEENNTIHLDWQLNNEQDLADLELQRSVNQGSYQTIKSYLLNSIIGFEPFDFMDASLPCGATAAYRLMAKTISGNIQYSPVIVFHLQGSRKFGIHPVRFVSTATLNLYSSMHGVGILRLAAFSGRIIWQEEVYLDKGNNSFALQRPDGLPDGNYSAVLQVGEQVYTQKIELASP